jgi:hypothetical protein
LVPLSTMIKIKAVIACGYFDNADGLCVINSMSGSKAISAPQRLRWTDSGHYMLPINNFRVGVTPKLYQSASKLKDLMAKSAPTAQKHASANLFSTFPVYAQDDTHEDFADATQSFR